MALNKYLIYVTVMATVTYLVRALPLVIFKEKINSKFINSFLSYIPYTVLGAMTFPGILYSTNSITSAMAAFCAAVTMAFLGKSLIQVALFACTIALTIQIFELYL